MDDQIDDEGRYEDEEVFARGSSNLNIPEPLFKIINNPSGFELDAWKHSGEGLVSEVE